MATNPHFRYYDYGPEQRLAEDLILESIKIHGLNVKYLPRTLVNQDFLLGEDPLSRFNLAVDVEVYIKDFLAFQGQGDFLSKFNLEVRDQITFTMSRRRWGQIGQESVLTEEGFNLQVESAEDLVYGSSESYLLEAGTANGYSISSSRPMEGDLIFFPLNNKLYEIKFVEHENIFYQHGKLYTYDITCELFDRDSRLRTGNTVIDTIETTYTQDIRYNQMLAEDGDVLLTEDGGSYILEFRLEDTVPTANNEAITQESMTVIDFSETNPFLDWN